MLSAVARDELDELAMSLSRNEEVQPTSTLDRNNQGTADLNKPQDHDSPIENLPAAMKAVDIPSTSAGCADRHSDGEPLDESCDTKELMIESRTKSDEEDPTCNDEDDNTKRQRKEPTIPATNISKNDPTKVESGNGGTNRTMDQSMKDPTALQSKDFLPDPEESNTTDETSDTDDTGCMSRTSDSDSEDSIDGPIEPKLGKQPNGRSRCFGGVTSHIENRAQSKSLSPTRSMKLHPLLCNKFTILSEEDIPNNIAESSPINTSSRAREIRIRRLQRGKGYVPLEGQSDQVNDSSLSYDSLGSPQHEPCDADNPDTGIDGVSSGTPRSKPWIQLDEKKEEDPSDTITTMDDPFLTDLIQPNLDNYTNAATHTKLKNDTYDDVQAMLTGPYDIALDDLDLQLIDLRRPIGAEYGDDERSL
jgi:hypothetical protein